MLLEQMAGEQNLPLEKRRWNIQRKLTTRADRLDIGGDQSLAETKSNARTLVALTQKLLTLINARKRHP